MNQKISIYLVVDQDSNQVIGVCEDRLQVNQIAQSKDCYVVQVKPPTLNSDFDHKNPVTFQYFRV